MTFELNDDRHSFCWLRWKLEPTFQVVAFPSSSYYSEHQFCYRIYDGEELIREFAGDFRTIRCGELAAAARGVVKQLAPLANRQSDTVSQPGPHLSQPAVTPRDVIASRLVPLRTDVTYFSSGRAAFTHLMSDVVRPKRVWLPAFVCWSLIAAMLERFPNVPLLFYPVDRRLRCRWPTTTEPGDALVFIHFFGHINERPTVPEHCTLLEDISHLLIPPPLMNGTIGFGSLRKLFRIADGGQIVGRHSPIYEADDGLISWLRSNSRDWRDLREAENMMDRGWKVSDMSSQSLAMLLSSDVRTLAEQRQRNQRYLHQHFPVGTPLVEFCDDEVPLLHNVVMPNKESRDSLRSFLAKRSIFCSIHWPLHPVLTESSNSEISVDAAWLQDHILSLPIADDFNETHMATICNATAEWQSAGG